MTNKQLAPKVRAWLKGTDHEPEDARRSVGIISSRAEQTGQRGRWWPLPSFRHRTGSNVANLAAQRRPTSIPVSNGHTPTVIERTTSMFSPVKAITAGAIVFALGSAFLIAQPFDRQANVPQAEAEAEAVAPTWITGNVAYAPSCKSPSLEVGGVVRHDWGYECSPQRWTSSDPRLTGEVSYRWNEDVYNTDEGFISVNTAAAYMRNDDGGWACSSSNLLEGSGLHPDTVTGETLTCVGEGGYEGLSALLVLDEGPAHPLVGLIFAGGFPPLPEPPAAE